MTSCWKLYITLFLTSWYIEEKSLPTMFLCLRATEEGKKEKEKKVEYRSQSAHSPL